MIRRFASDLSVLLLGSFLAVVSQAVAPGAVQWWLLAVGALAVAIGAYGAYDTARGSTHRPVDGLVGVLGLFAIVASFAWSGGALLDVALVAGVLLALAGTTGLVIHERQTERVVHALEVSHPAESREGRLVHH